MPLKPVMLAMISVSALLGAGQSPAQQDAPDERRDWAGMRRDLYYLIGWQAVATVIIYHAPFEFSNWSEDEKDNLGFKQWAENVTDPVWDEDHWAVNYVLHPYWGAGYYIRGRERGFSRRESFWIAALYSTVYEFGVESFLEQPSIQDIIVTPVAGAAVGAYFEKVRNRIRSKSGPLTFFDKVKLGLIDPLGALNRGVNRLIGFDESQESQLVIGFRPVRAAPVLAELHHGGQVDVVGHDIDGIRLTFNYQW